VQLINGPSVWIVPNGGNCQLMPLCPLNGRALKINGIKKGDTVNMTRFIKKIPFHLVFPTSNTKGIIFTIKDVKVANHAGSFIVIVS
jgi:hypothetical protein